MTVLDASVLAKLFLVEALSDTAEALVANHSLLFAPEIARVEVASAITRAYRRRTIDGDEAREELARWRRFTLLDTVRFVSDSALLSEAETLALTLCHPLADCLYLSLATREDLPLVTADRPFLDALGKRFPNVRHLADHAE